MKIAVKELAQFLYASGDLTYEFSFNYDENEGIKAHQYLQNKYPSTSRREVHIDRVENINDIEIEISGIIDGVHLDNLIEEIKSTKNELDKNENHLRDEHLAQLKMYMAMYLLENDLDEINGNLTYININTYETKSISYKFDRKEILEFYYNSLEEYIQWELFLQEDYELKSQTLKQIRFPFESYRPGQKEFMKAAFCTLRDNKILYGVAPTGIGKTASVLYPAFKSLKRRKDKIFYLTSKSTLKKLAVDTTSLMIKNSLGVRLIELTSKEKMCFLHCEICDPENCSFAIGFFKKLRLALKDIMREKIITRDVVEKYATTYSICPFEFSLYVSELCDLIICDYNYAFDPQVKLIRYFENERNYNIFTLVDEAHNLVDRSRSMYSSELSVSVLKGMKKSFRGLKPTINKIVNNIIKYLDEIYVDTNRLILDEGPDKLIGLLHSLVDRCQKIFQEEEKIKFKNYHNSLIQYLELNQFMKINDLFSTSHRFIIEKNEDYVLKIECLDSSKFIHKIIKSIDGAVLFSATLTPLDYYTKLLTEGEGDRLILPSPFNQKNLKLIFMDKVDTYYQNRKNSLDEIKNIIDVMVKAKEGNYIVFFPSYEYLKMVYDYIGLFESPYKIILQEKDMSIEERQTIINMFDENEKTQVGFFVMGGIFSEGIDYVGDRLSGVLIVSVCLPQVNYSNELLKDYFNEKFTEGFDFAYTYPGFNKVMQAAGRVIRSVSDKGVVIIADKRITNYKYLQMLPNHWSHYKKIKNHIDLLDELNKFWNTK